MTNEKRKRVSDAVREYYNEAFGESFFVPGESYIPATGRKTGVEELLNLVDASLDMWLTSGRYCEEFERRFSQYLGLKHCSLVNSGSSANLLAMTALTSYKLGERALQKGDEVITVAAGFPTTVAPIIQNGLIPVFVDIEADSYNIDPDLIEQAITDKTRAICIAHTLGNPFDIGRVMQICQKYDLWLIEDNCDALGSRYKGQLTGTFGHISTYSFYPAHHITMGEGGAVVTGDSQLHRILLSLRDWGRDCWCHTGKDNTCRGRFTQQHGTLPLGYDHKYVYSHLGYNLKLTDMQAAVGVAQLKKLPKFIEKRKENAEILFKKLETMRRVFILPRTLDEAEANWFSFPLLIRDGVPFGRLELVKFLEDRKIGTRLLFAGNVTRQPLFVENDYEHRISGNLKNTDFVMERMFSIGCFPGIGREEIDYIYSVLSEFLWQKGVSV